MNAQTIELVLKVLEVAGPIIAQVPTLGAKWIKNRNEVAAMVKEGRNPTVQEHARLTREMHFLTKSLDEALATAEAAAEERIDEVPVPVEVADVVEAAVSVAAEVAGAVVELSADAPAEEVEVVAEETPEEEAVADEVTDAEVVDAEVITEAVVVGEPAVEAEE